MIKVSRIAHATFETPDLERALEYYTQVIGLISAANERERAFLATRTGQVVVQLERGGRARCVSFAFEVAADTDFAAMRQRLADAGIKSEDRHQPAPGIAKILRFPDPNGTGIELFSEWSHVETTPEVGGVGPLKLGHVAHFTPDPHGVALFYERVLGFRISDWIDDFFVFMRCNPDHHSVNFLRGDAARLHHFAFELRDVSHVVNSCDVLGHARIPLVWGPLRFGPGHNVAVFHRNPDDALVEFYAELDQMKNEDLGYFDPRPWHRDKPQRPKVWKFGDDMIWGPPPPPGFM